MIMMIFKQDTLSLPFSHRKNVSSCSMSWPDWPEISLAKRFKFSMFETLALISTLEAMIDGVVPIAEKFN